MWYRNCRRIDEAEVVDTIDVSFWGIAKRVVQEIGFAAGCTSRSSPAKKPTVARSSKEREVLVFRVDEVTSLREGETKERNVRKWI
jgi:PAB1-binding protein PBP1